MGPVFKTLRERGPMREDELAIVLASGVTPEELDSELEHLKAKTLAQQDGEGYWALTEAADRLR